MAAPGPAPKLHLVDIVLKPVGANEDLAKRINQLRVMFTSKKYRVHYCFKVTGEPRVVAVIGPLEENTLEGMLVELYRVGNVEVTCELVFPLDVFGRVIGVDETALGSMSFDAEGGVNDLYMVQGVINNYTVTTDEWIEILKDEVTYVLAAHNGGFLDATVYKVVAQRKVVMFIRDKLENLERLTFTVPLMRRAGGSTLITNRPIQNLAEYNPSHK